MEDSLPLVSIVLINYNNEKYVLDTLYSIESQTYENIEIIVVDDCSTDSSPKIITEWLKKARRKTQFIQHTENNGICATCNSGFKAAGGKYVSYMATDDIMLPEKTELQVKALETTDDSVAAIFSDAYMIDEEGNMLYGKAIQRGHPYLTRIPSGRVYKKLIEKNFIPPMTAMFKNSIFKDIGYFDETLLFEDRDMFLRIAKKYQIIFSDFVSAKYRLNTAGISSKIRDWDTHELKTLIKHSDDEECKAQVVKLSMRIYYSHRTKDIIKCKELKKIPVARKVYYLSLFKIPPRLGNIYLGVKTEKLY
jgi:glycosyltransferase involved in cell wall biosynthesis